MRRLALALLLLGSPAQAADKGVPPFAQRWFYAASNLQVEKQADDLIEKGKQSVTVEEMAVVAKQRDDAIAELKLLIEELDDVARPHEIGRMLSGQTLTPEALKHAEQLIRMSSA